MKRNVFGIDIAKLVFQIHWVDTGTGEMHSEQVKRGRFLEWFSKKPSSQIGIEACSGAHHWARQLIGMGHDVKLLPAHRVKPFVVGNKNDVADARGIWTALQQPGMKTVAVKTESQQAVLSLHRMREQLVKFRTAQINGLRGLLAEFGEVAPKGRAALKNQLPDCLARLCDQVPTFLMDSLREQWARISQLDVEIRGLEKRLQDWLKQDEACQRVAKVPGVGLLTATALVATMSDPKTFKSGREFAAWLGLVPRQTGTGGRVQLHGISKRGDIYLRTLLIHGARSVMNHNKQPDNWLARLQQRRPNNVALVAQANKTARTVWALLAHGRDYQSGWLHA